MNNPITPNEDSPSFRRAFIYAPPIAPLSFIAVFLIVASSCMILGIKLNTLSIIGIPLVSLIYGIPLAYALTFVLWLPLMILLHRRGHYNLKAVLGASFGMALIFMLLSPLMIHSSEPWDKMELIKWMAMVFIGTCAPIVV